MKTLIMISRLQFECTPSYLYLPCAIISRFNQIELPLFANSFLGKYSVELSFDVSEDYWGMNTNAPAGCYWMLIVYRDYIEFSTHCPSMESVNYYSTAQDIWFRLVQQMNTMKVLEEHAIL